MRKVNSLTSDLRELLREQVVVDLSLTRTVNGVEKQVHLTIVERGLQHLKLLLQLGL